MKITYQKDGHMGYWVSLDGKQIGYVNAAWRRTYGGACWSVKYEDRTEYFGTRKQAAHSLAMAVNA